jgi:hypothetical protein
MPMLQHGKDKMRCSAVVMAFVCKADIFFVVSVVVAA